MLKSIRRALQEGDERRKNGERGATPIEILAGLVLLGIIFGFIIVKFFSWRETTQDKSAQTNLRNASLAAESIYTLEHNYIGANIAAAATPAICDGVDGAKRLNCVEPELVFQTATTGMTPGDNRVLVAVSNVGSSPSGANQVIQFTTWSATGRMWCLKVVSDDGATGAGNTVGTHFGGGGKAAAATNLTSCAANRTKY